MAKKRYPKGCSDLGRLTDHLRKEEKKKKAEEYRSSTKPTQPKGENNANHH